MSLRLQTDICTVGKLADKCSLLGKWMGKDRRLLMLQVAPWGQEVWDGFSRPHHLCRRGETPGSAQGGGWNWTLMCKHDLVQSPPRQEGEGSSSPSCSSLVFYCPHSVHSLLSFRHNFSFYVHRQGEGYQWIMVETAEVFPAWCSCKHAWGTCHDSVLIPNGSSWRNQQTQLQFVVLLVGSWKEPAAPENTQTTHRRTCCIHPSQKLHLPFSCPSLGTQPCSHTVLCSISQINGAGQERRTI